MKYLLLIAALFLVGCDDRGWILTDVNSHVDITYSIHKNQCLFDLGQVVSKNKFYSEHSERLKCVYKEFGEGE